MRMHLGIVLAIGGLAACGGKNKGGSGKVIGDGMGSVGSAGGQVQDLRIPKVDPSLCDTKDKKIASFDLNHDDKPDSWKLYMVKEEKGIKSEIITCKQVDLNYDGDKDYVVQYDIDGNMILEEVNLDYDDHFDARIHYDKVTHLKFLVERETGTDGKPDLWEEWAYTTGKDQNEWLSRILRDRDADEKPDYWELWRKKTLADGRDSSDLEAILYDDDFDGKVEKREDAVVATPPPPAGDQPASEGSEGAKPPEEGSPDEKPADEPAKQPAEKPKKK